MPGPGPGFHAMWPAGASRGPFMQLSDLLPSDNYSRPSQRDYETRGFALPRERLRSRRRRAEQAFAGAETRSPQLNCRGTGVSGMARTLHCSGEGRRGHALECANASPIDKPGARVPNRPEPGGRHPTIAAHARGPPTTGTCFRMHAWISSNKKGTPSDVAVIGNGLACRGVPLGNKSRTVVLSTVSYWLPGVSRYSKKPIYHSLRIIWEKGKGACHNLAHDAAGVMSCIDPWGVLLVSPLCHLKKQASMNGRLIDKKEMTGVCDNEDGDGWAAVGVCDATRYNALLSSHTLSFTPPTSPLHFGGTWVGFLPLASELPIPEPAAVRFAALRCVGSLELCWLLTEQGILESHSTVTERAFQSQQTTAANSPRDFARSSAAEDAFTHRDRELLGTSDCNYEIQVENRGVHPREGEEEKKKKSRVENPSQLPAQTPTRADDRPTAATTSTDAPIQSPPPPPPPPKPPIQQLVKAALNLAHRRHLKSSRRPSAAGGARGDRPSQRTTALAQRTLSLVPVLPTSVHISDSHNGTCPWIETLFFGGIMPQSKLISLAFSSYYGHIGTTYRTTPPGFSRHMEDASPSFLNIIPIPDLLVRNSKFSWNPYGDPTKKNTTKRANAVKRLSRNNISACVNL
ncbi:uncharacterized protein CLUP02_08339 [Colletotrichum lupini]|uniref:Uncharacterized protein n=1 Tax=Colletotrichum lupini TaxID=145971 RepID=A0A9Q8SSP9_9PEZI|nr:uncharacterized protein CLUP02_08339 [Colletotrichum lupini]UQC82849.1 hypothetical protein CLUP02_08339 [Colletotrichum lupini]